MLQIKELQYAIGDRELLNGISWNINPGKRVALIGPNGAGKTTLLRIIVGDLEYHSGSMIMPQDYVIGYLPQEEVHIGKGPILTTVLEGNKEITDLEWEIYRIHEELNENPDNQEVLLERLGTAESRYRLLGGYQLESTARSILSGLGFSAKDHHRSLTEFSGGWRMRVYLARLLIQNPDLLLLDEPTNHLDLPSLEWLEYYLRNFQGSVVIVSHDRFFIDRLAQEIVELNNGKLEHYSGNYHYFEEQKKSRMELLLKKQEQIQKEKARQQQFIDRFRYKATKAAQVQSRLKQLDKLETIELPQNERHISFRIKVEKPSYQDVLQIENMSFHYDAGWVLREINFSLFRGERVALVGVNGAGKTTLTRLITSQLHPQQGRIQLGERVSVGYYAQHQVEQLDLDRDIYDEVLSSSAAVHRPHIRNILGLFQFTGDEVSKRIGVLSGGEKARVSLAKILTSPVNFLIMDEPTNHLDIASRDALENALVDYDGTLLLISHDRYFLDKLVNRVIELKDTRLTEYEGNYSHYLEKREGFRDSGIGGNEISPTSAIKNKNQKEKKRREAEARQAISKERNHLEGEIRKLEETIQRLDEVKLRLEQEMSDPQNYRDGEKAAALQLKYVDTKKSLETSMESWESLQVTYQKLLESLKEE